MLVTFEKQYLYDLYTKGKTNDKKHRFQPDIVKRYKRCVDLLKNSPSISSITKYNSLNYEQLIGDKQGISSIRVNDQYRIEFVVSETKEEPIVTICNIIELSNHYK